jgi:transposase InsO family protein
MIIQENIDPKDPLSIQHITRLMNVSRCGYYKWLHQSNSNQNQVKIDMQIRDELQKIAIDYPGYGYRRMTVELRRRGHHLNHKRVLKLMREDSLLCFKKKFKPLTTNSNHDHKIYPNLIRGMEITGPNQVWASDITYIQLTSEFTYLAVILDLFTRRCIGWELSRNIDTQLALSALDNALKDRWNPDIKRLIHHSDQGVQYASREYIDRLKKHDFQISMSRKGNPYDNAFIESFIKTLKCEEVYLNEYETFRNALDNISRFIDEVYNKKRLHSSLGYRSPIEFEQEAKLNILA